ncbi:SH3-domain-containing protein [Meira miltonrushii]|uniref:SH3-domain-containing protein n=1 Tax=Meira miltonrushii TaxID=1280837 RepID=A0A316VJ04_9BASI|nr:SH3-domain-containing protein [Meira miltonrushii]PWN37204.1 SH3-domain-containing protein [Meira miltonrushii]
MTESAQQIAKRVLVDLDALVGQGKLQQHQIASIRSELEPVARPAPPPIIARKPAVVARKRFRAIWSYNGADADEISFNEGDLLEMIEEVSEGWWKGCVVQPDGRKGQEGMFPSNYVEVLPDNTIVAPQRMVPPLPQRQLDNGPPAYGNQNIDDEKRAMGYHTPPPQQPYSDAPAPLGPPKWQPGVARWSSGPPMPPPPPPSNFSPGPMSPPPQTGYYNQPPMPYGGATPGAYGNQPNQQLQQIPEAEQAQKRDKVSILVGCDIKPIK